MKKPKLVRTTFSQYSISDVKGEGGSGVVYEASDEDGNKFAIKTLDPAKASKEKLRRFKNEFSFCSRDRHPNIIRVLDHGITNEGIPFFVMPLYDGSLRGLVGKLEAKRVISIFVKIMDGIEAAHKLGVIHRDIKPENILIRAGGNELVVSDFGIAEFKEEDLYTAVETKDETRLANFQYAAPEQRSRGRKVDHKADIYSLGLVLNELFTGEIPYGTNFKRISTATGDYPYLDAIVERMLVQDPQARFDSIEVIKREMIARGEEHIALQKVNKLEQTVVPTADIDDPLVRDPMRIIKIDWADNVLFIELNHPINPTWQWALQNMGSHSAVWGKGPDNFQFRGNRAIIGATSDEAQGVVNYFKQWLPRANQVYEGKLREIQQTAEREQREALERQIQKEKERIDILQKLKF